MPESILLSASDVSNQVLHHNFSCKSENVQHQSTAYTSHLKMPKMRASVKNRDSCDLIMMNSGENRKRIKGNHSAYKSKRLRFQEVQHFIHFQCLP